MSTGTGGTTEFSVDSVNKKLSLVVKDDKGDVIPVADLATTTVEWSTSNVGVLAVANDPTDVLSADLTLNTAGAVTVTAHSSITDASGAPLPDAAVNLTIDPGAPAEQQVVVSS